MRQGTTQTQTELLFVMLASVSTYCCECQYANANGKNVNSSSSFGACNGRLFKYIIILAPVVCSNTFHLPELADNIYVNNSN